jgi:uncharacterized protein
LNQFFIKFFNISLKNKTISKVLYLLFLLLLFFFTSKIKFEEDITKVIPQNQNSSTLVKALKQLSFSDKITVILNHKNKEQLLENANVFIDSIKQHENYYKNIQGVIDENQLFKTYNFIYNHLPFYLDDVDYQKIEQKINADSVIFKMESNYKQLLSPSGMISKDFILKDPLGITNLGLKKLETLRKNENLVFEDGFLFTKDYQNIILFITPKFSSTDSKKNKSLHSFLMNFQKNHTTIKIDYFGSLIIAAENEAQIKNDIFKTVTIAVCILFILLIYYFKKIYLPIIAFIPSLFGVGFSLAILSIIKPSISAISISIGAMLLGITIDFSLHILNHLKHNQNIENLYQSLTKPILNASITTAISFACLTLVNSEVLRDLGLFAGLTVLSSSVFSLLILPHLFKKPQKSSENFIHKLSNFPFEKNKFLLIITLFGVLISFFVANKVKFDNDISKLNFMSEKSKLVEKNLNDILSFSKQSLYVVAHGETLNKAFVENQKLENILEKFKNQQLIEDVKSFSNIIISEEIQKEKIEKWQNFWKKNFLKYTQNVNKSALKHGFKDKAFIAFEELIQRPFNSIPIEQFNDLGLIDINDIYSQSKDFHAFSNLIKVENKHRESILKSLEKQNYLVIDRKNVNEVFLSQLKDEFLKIINYSLLAVILVLLFFFRRIELVLIALIPIVFTGILTMGLLYFFNIPLNVFSIIVCTLIIGHSIDFTIFMTDALRATTNEKRNIKTSIVLSIITTLFTLGALVFAKHPALFSIASVAIIGILSAWIMTFILYPKMFNLFIQKRSTKGISPITIFLFIHSILSFLYYGLGGIFFSIFGKIFIKLLPVKEEKKIIIFRKIVSWFMGSVFTSNPFIKVKIENKNNENFDKQAVIIANHTSFLDILAIGMLNYKLIYLVNDWVYNSPFFGKVVKLIGFIPVSQGMENGVNLLKDKIEKGYSIVVFPEGTRSVTNVIQRFHKGAFYLANHFKLDILPIYLHGNSETLPKNDYIIYREKLTIIIEDRIKYNESFEDFVKTTKSIQKNFREKFNQIRIEKEDENYFYNLIRLSYLFEEFNVRKSIKEIFNNNKSTYYNLNQVISNQDIIIYNNDFGLLGFMLILQNFKRQITLIINDENQLVIAKRNYLTVKGKIKIVNSEYEIENFNQLLIIDNEKPKFYNKFKEIININNTETVENYSIEKTQ